MNWDDDAPKPKRAVTVGENLERHSLAELEERIIALKDDIVRVQAEITAKTQLAAAAAALFDE